MPSWRIGGNLDALHKQFFARSERHRRWRLDDDIDWSAQAPVVPDSFVMLAETFWAVESFLPDYTSKIASAFRTERGRVWVHAMWAYEESKHGRALEEWLLRGGHRTETELDDLSQTMWLAGENELPHQDDRKMLIYQMLQEGMARMVYSRFRRLATEAGDGALSDVLRHLTSDEQSHYGFFRDCVRLWMEEDPEGTTTDLYDVLTAFSMPAGAFIPEYKDRDALMQRSGVGSPQLFLNHVWLPTANSLGIDALPPGLRPLRDAGVSIEDMLRMLGGGEDAEPALTVVPA